MNKSVCGGGGGGGLVLRLYSTVMLLMLTVFIANITLTQSQVDSKSYSSCLSQWSADSANSAVVTFIVPSTIRPTLVNTLHSLQAQHNPHWLAIVIFDGLVSNASSLYLNPKTRLPYYYHDLSTSLLQDRRLCIVHTTRKRTANCAANTRNSAIRHAPTKWVGFVDDDDVLDSRYVDHLLDQEKTHPTAACVIFRMCAPVEGNPNAALILPPREATDFFRNEVGISFAVQSNIFQDFGYYFFPSNAEDFLFLNQLRKDGLPIALSPYVTYYVKGFNHSTCQEGHIQSQLIQHGKSNIYLRESAKWKMKTKRTELWNADIYNCTNRWAKQPPNIFFTESKSIFFQHNVNALKLSLQQAMAKGCLGKWTFPPIDIHVIFDATTKPKSPFYIQVQLEQRHSFHFSNRYVDKLNQAIQVWEFTHPENGQEVNSIPGVNTSLYYVPTMLMLDQNPPVYSCDQQLYSAQQAEAGNQTNTIASSTMTSSWITKILKKLPQSFAFLLYRHGIYTQCSISAGKIAVTNMTRSSCASSSSHAEGYCWKGNISLPSSSEYSQHVAQCEEALFPPQHTIDVLTFGKLQGSYLNNRERVCDGLIEKGHLVACVEDVFNQVLNHFVCMAKMVVVNHYFKTSALETHRIDPLLQVGKVVVAVASPNPVIDRYYAPYFPIVSVKDIVSTTDHILKHYEVWTHEQHYHERMGGFVQSIANNVDPLCLALSHISSTLRSSRNGFASKIEILQLQEDMKIRQYYEDKLWYERMGISVRWFILLICLYLVVKFRGNISRWYQSVANTNNNRMLV